MLSSFMLSTYLAVPFRALSHMYGSLTTDLELYDDYDVMSSFISSYLWVVPSYDCDTFEVSSSAAIWTTPEA